MTVSAELIQASINKATGDIVYTFHLIYPRKSWLNVFGNLFENYLKAKETTTVSGTSFHHAIDILEVNAMNNCDDSAYGTLAILVHERTKFASLVLNAIRSGRTIGIITSKEVKEAQRLFGDRVQEVLKVYDIGEWHRPLGATITLLERYSIHDRKATEHGWE